MNHFTPIARRCRLSLTAMVFSIVPPGMSSAPNGNPDPAVVKGSNQLGWSILSQLVSAEKADPAETGVFVSPAGLATCLYLATAGAEGETRRELLNLLGVADTPAGVLESSAGNLITNLQPASAEGRGLFRWKKPETTEVVLRSANGVWIREGLNFAPDYLAKVKSGFRSEVGPLDAPAINAWVARQTENRITQIIDRTDGDMIAVLTNAVYFRGKWKEPFEKSSTKIAEFSRADGTTVSTPFMNQTGDFAYGESAHGKAVVLPYTSDAGIRMIAVLPRESPAELLRALEKENAWPTLLGSLENEKGTVSLPKFKARCSYSSEIEDAIVSLGAKRPFSRNDAEFGAMVNMKDVQALLGSDANGLFIDRIAHELFLEVDEEGTEAAAVTSFPVLARSDRTSPFSLKFNRPFLIVIEAPRTQTILFAGVLFDPSISLPD